MLISNKGKHTPACPSVASTTTSL